MKSKYLPLVAILTLIILLGTAATCNLCGITPTTETVSSDTAENETDYTSAQDTEEETVAEATEEETAADVSTVITEGIVNHATKQIALTFDAGWLYENTEALLNLLDEYNVKATFFVRGLWVKEHPDLAAEIVDRGHALENHSLTHGHMSTMTDAEVKNEIRKTTDMIKEKNG